jgi:biopolymer transport protein ExbD
MGKTRTKDRLNNEINAGSMADIAFLLLIFFLVTTTIAEDKGLLVLLPPWSEEPPDTKKLKTRNVYSVLVNADNQLLVRGQAMDIKSLKDNTKNFIKNPTRAEDMAESADQALISLKNDRGTKYKTYLMVYNELKAAYAELRDEESEKRYGKKFEYLEKDQQRQIATEIPLVISEAEPTAFGDEN